MTNISSLSQWFLGVGFSALVALSLVGCVAEEDVIYVVITSTPPPQVVAEATPEPTDTPTPQPTATPNIPPEAGLRIANQLWLNGYYEDAIAAYQSVLANPSASADTRATAALNAGRAALREGLFDVAVGVLTLLINDYPDDLRAQQAYFLRGDAYMGLSRWTEAINDFRQYLRLRPGIIDSYAHERIGDSFLAIGFFDDALASYRQATEANRSLAPLLRLREKVAQVYLSAGDTAQALAQYEAILQVAQNAPYRAQIELRIAETLLADGGTAEANNRLLRIVTAYPDQPQAYTALGILEANGQPVNALQAGRIRFNNADYTGAIMAFNTFSTTAPLADIPAEMHLLLGRAYREVGNAPAALIAFDTILRQYPTDPLIGDALLEQGRTRFLSGDTDGAINFYLNIAENFGYLRATSAQALWRAGFLYSQNGQEVSARQVFERLARDYPETEEARNGLSTVAFAALRTDDIAAAEEYFTRLAGLSTAETQAEAFLLIGQIARNRGDDPAADRAFAQAIQASPDSYFAARASDLRDRRAPFTPPATYRFEFDDAADIAETEAWLRATFGIEQGGALWVLAPELAADPRLVRGQELWTMGQVESAEIEFFDLLNANRENPLASFQLALFYRGIGSYLPSMQSAANIITLAGAGTLNVPHYLARLRYPVYYLAVIEDASARYNLDPLLLAALIRHESLFNTNATAAAGEKGLTQVIPSTAQYIADRLNFPDYEHSVLFRPYAGIEFGAYYLAEQMNAFGRNVYAALSAYNAGPGRAQAWLASGGTDPDLYLSAITISSTRLYIQLIYRNYYIYRALYGAG